jgi:hypothetical protein
MRVSYRIAAMADRETLAFHLKNAIESGYSQTSPLRVSEGAMSVMTTPITPNAIRSECGRR